MKGIILAGGKGSRLYPATKVVSKQLLPIYDKPMIYYPLAVLMLLDIREVLIISDPRDIDAFRNLFGDGSFIGMKFSFLVQDQPAGIAEAFLIGENFIGNDSVCLILGDNIFYGDKFTDKIREKIINFKGALILGYQVSNPGEFGVVEFDKNNLVVSIKEKPVLPKSNYAVPGLYFYDKTVILKAQSLSPSLRGELEITDINNLYIKDNLLEILLLGRGVAWLDTGSAESIKSASEFVEVIQTRQGQYIACIEEIAWRKKYIDEYQLKKLADNLRNSKYGNYLLKLLNTPTLEE